MCKGFYKGNQKTGTTIGNVEDILHLFLSLDTNNLDDEILTKLWNVQVSQIRYLQEEHAFISNALRAC